MIALEIATITALAAPPIELTRLSNFRRITDENTVGIRSGDRIVARLDANPADGTEVTATQGGVTLSLRRSPPGDIFPNRFSRSTANDGTLTGAWTHTATNPGYATTVATSPSLGSPPALPYRKQADVERYIDGLCKAGILE
jgi:hypothetical protein